MYSESVSLQPGFFCQVFPWTLLLTEVYRALCRGSPLHALPLCMVLLLAVPPNANMPHQRDRAALHSALRPGAQARVRARKAVLSLCLMLTAFSPPSPSSLLFIPAPLIPLPHSPSLSLPLLPLPCQAPPEMIFHLHHMPTEDPASGSLRLMLGK